MKILLVKPYNQSDHIQPSLGLGYLAAAVRQKHAVAILDCIKEGVKAEDLRKVLERERPDIVGIQCYTYDLSFVSAALKEVKAFDPKTVTIIGGPHPSALPKETFELFGRDLDYLFVGEAENGFPLFADALAAGNGDLSPIPGLAWRSETGIVVNPPQVTEDLDRIPMPAWDLIKPQTYPESQHGAFFEQFPIAPIMVTRGCPFPCTFCAGYIVSGRKIRRRSVSRVLDEIVHLKERYGIREFHIIDDNFTMDPAYAKELLGKLRQLDLKMSWAVPNGIRMDTLDPELLRIMKESGLYLISLGIESGSNRILRSMRKGIDTRKMRSRIQMIKDAGIDMAGFFILGFPGETEHSIKRTIAFARSLPLVRANFFTYLPFPGTESYRILSETGELERVNWEQFYFTNAAYVPKGMTRQALKRWQRLAFAHFYLRPRIIWYQIRSVRSFRHFLFLAKRFVRWIVVR